MCYASYSVLVSRAHFYLLPYHMCTTGPLLRSTGLTSDFAEISMFSSFLPYALVLLTYRLPSYSVYAFPRLLNHSIPSSSDTLFVYPLRVARILCYLLILFCVLLSTILRICHPLTKAY